jgi:hypothetical protein
LRQTRLSREDPPQKWRGYQQNYEVQVNTRSTQTNEKLVLLSGVSINHLISACCLGVRSHSLPGSRAHKSVHLFTSHFTTSTLITVTKMKFALLFAGSTLAVDGLKQKNRKLRGSQAEVRLLMESMTNQSTINKADT